MLNKTGAVFKTGALFSFTGLHIFNGSVYLSCAIFNAKRVIWTNRWYQNFSFQGSKIVTKKKEKPRKYTNSIKKWEILQRALCVICFVLRNNLVTPYIKT